LATLEQRLELVRVRLREIELWRDREAVDLNGWLCDGEPIAIGAAWGRTDGVVRLEHPGAAVPEAWPLETAFLELAPGGEGLVRIEFAGHVESFGVDPNHRRFPLPGRQFRLQVDAVARLPFGQPKSNPSLEVARLVRVELELERLMRRLGLAADAAAALGDGDTGWSLADLATGALARLSWPSETEAYLGRAARLPDLRGVWSPPAPAARPEPLDDAARASIAAAHSLLDSGLARLQAVDPPRGRLALSGHAHLDLAWLWPLAETQRKAVRTFHTAAGLLVRHPEMTFTQSSAELYELVREADPALFDRVRELVAGGRWEPAGGMWVEPDVNLTAGESIVRQLLYGQRWFERELGGRHEVGWLPDCFGYTPALPQLLAGAGITAFSTTKLSWSEVNRFPHDLFWWEGLDGTRLLTHCFTGYNGRTSPQDLLDIWRRYSGRLISAESLYTVGYGDGGGGPTAEMVADIRELASFPALPEARFDRLDAFFARRHDDATAPEGRALPVWVGEMYLELHRGTYTTQGRTKRLHRRAERDLVAAEVAWSLARLAGTGIEHLDLGGAWRLLMRNQFHDILPGSGIAEVSAQAEAEVGEVIGAAGEAIEQALGRLRPAVAPSGDRPAVLLVNPDLSARPLRAVLPAELPGAQRVEAGWAVTGSQPVAGLEAVMLLEAEPPPEPASADGRRLENEFLRVELADDGSLASVFDRRAGRETLAGPGNQLWAYVDKPRGWDAWDIDAGYGEQGEPLGPPESIEVVETGPHRAAIRVRRRHRDSTLVQDIRLWASSPRLEVATRIEWHDRRLLLKALLPLAVRSASAVFETAFGVVERPTHRNTSWDAARFEVPAHRFVDLSEPGYGVALLNDGRYGHHALGSELGLSLLRSPVYPDPRADEGEHEFTYALLPHAGTWVEGGVLAEAEDLNRPLLALPCTAGGSGRLRQLTVECSEGLVLGLAALKPAEDEDGLVLRLYEPQGARGRARVQLPQGWHLAAELNLLEDRVGPPNLGFTPFQVRSHLCHPTA
jgi:alpha-mannosidase